MAAAALVWLRPLAAWAKPGDPPDDSPRTTGAKDCLVVRAVPSRGEPSPVLVTERVR